MCRKYLYGLVFIILFSLSSVASAAPALLAINMNNQAKSYVIFKYLFNGQASPMMNEFPPGQSAQVVSIEDKLLQNRLNKAEFSTREDGKSYDCQIVGGVPRRT